MTKRKGTTPRGLTAYQVEILRHLMKATADEPLDFDQLLDKLSWTPSKESAQFSLRAMVGKDLIRKDPALRLRRGRKRVCWLITREGVIAMDPRASAGPAPDSVEIPVPGTLPEDKLALTHLEGVIPPVPGVPELEMEVEPDPEVPSLWAE